MSTTEITYDVLYPEKGTVLDEFDRHSKYLVKIIAPKDLSQEFYSYARKFKYAVYVKTV